MSDTLDYSDASSLEGRCLALKKCIQDYLKKDQVEFKELIELANSFDYSLLRSKSVETRKLAVLFIAFILHLLHVKTPVSSKYGFFDCLEISGPFFCKGSFIYLTFDHETDVSFSHKFMNSTLSKQDDILFNYAVKRSNDKRILLLGVCVDRTLQILSQPNLLDCLPDPKTTCIFINTKQVGKLPFLSLELNHLGFADWRRTYKGFKEGAFADKLQATAKQLFGLASRYPDDSAWSDSIREKAANHFKGLVRLIKVQNCAKSKRQNSAADLDDVKDCLEDQKTKKPAIKVHKRTNSSNKFRIVASEQKSASQSTDTKGSFKKSATDSDKPTISIERPAAGKTVVFQQLKPLTSTSSHLKKLQSMSFEHEASAKYEAKESRFVRVSRKVKTELPGPDILTPLTQELSYKKALASLGLEEEPQSPLKHNFFLKKADSPKKQPLAKKLQAFPSPGSSAP